MNNALRCAALTVTVIVMAAAIGLAWQTPTSAPNWKVGLAKAIITPDKAVWLAGYGSKRVPDGKIHDIWVKAMALEDPKGRRVVLLTSDFQGVPKSMSDRVFDRLKKDHQLERSRIMFTFSHNH